EHATFALTNKALNVDRQPALPRVWGLPMEGEKQEWRGVPVGLTLTDTSLCLLLRFDDGDASRVWNGFEIEPYPNAKLTLVSNCAISRKAWLDAQEDDANREQ